MAWAEGELKKRGRISALAAWLPTSGDDRHGPEVRTQSRNQMRAGEGPEENAGETIEAQEAALITDLSVRWRDGEVAAVALVAPVLFGKASTSERAEAVRLHIEARSGYCADILMPYRVRPALRWRGKHQNRVHFSHPVAQESVSRLGGPPAPTETSCLG